MNEAWKSVLLSLILGYLFGFVVIAYVARFIQGGRTFRSLLVGAAWPVMLFGELLEDPWMPRAMSWAKGRK